MAESRVLEQCGISESLIRRSRRRGLFVPKTHERIPESFMTSPSDDWVVEWADRFTPPLSTEEIHRYTEAPNRFYEDAVRSAKFMRKMSGVLLHALDKCEKLRPERALAAYLAVLRIYYAMFDFQIYKYDRHLEFHEYEESPVGYFWKQLKDVCLSAMKKAGASDPEKSAEEKRLQILCSSGRSSLSLQYELACAKLSGRFSELRLERLTPDILVLKLKRRYPKIYQLAITISREYYKDVEEVVRKSLELRSEAYKGRILKSRTAGKKALVELEKRLSSKEIAKLHRCIKALDYFMLTQEKIVFIIDSKVEDGSGYVRDAEFRTLDLIGRLLKASPWLVRSGFMEEIDGVFQSKPPLLYVAPRVLLYNSEKKHYFNETVERLYLEELQRWF